MSTTTAVRGFTRGLLADSNPPNDATTSMEAPQAQAVRRRPAAARYVARITLSPEEEALGVSWERLVWQVPYQLPAFEAFVVQLQAEPWQLGYPSDAVICSSPLQFFDQRPEAEPESWRGVFAFRHEHTEIFSEPIELNLRTLPRLKPQITLTRRMLEDDDE